MNRTFHRLLSLALAVALLMGAVGFLSPTETVTLTADAAETAPPTFAPQTDHNNLIGKAVTGYQAWFGQGWYHNWANVSPTRNRMFEMWPHTADYPSGSLWNSASFGTLNNGDKAQLFNSTNAGVIDTHFKWMHDYNIDGAAVQRFYGYTRDTYSASFAYLKTIMQKAEKYDRLFYMMYDMSGAGGNNDPATVVSRMKNDFINNVEGQGLVSSTAYAHADGKPVVCLWGLSGVADSGYPNATVARQLVTWFKERGYYVIVGTPDNDFSVVTDEYSLVYAAADMISPWYVGRFSMSGVGSSLRNNIQRDKGYCDAKGIDFLPVIFPGFAWTNLKNGTQYNEIARAGGKFLWREGVMLAMCGCDTVYFAMFDEYDEATAIMKGTSDATEIPKEGYFLTYAADGYWLSNDYYLRLAGAINDMLTDVAAGKIDPLDIYSTIPVRYSDGPVYYRNGFTYHTATVEEETVTVRVDPGVGNEARTLTNFRGGDQMSLTAATAEQTDADGWFYRLSGESTASADAAGAIHRVVSETNFVLAADTVLTYRLRAADVNGQGVYVNLLLADGTLLRQRMITASDTGAKAGEWVKATVPISNDLAGQTVTAIVVSCNLTTAGVFSADIDDIEIATGAAGSGNFTAVPAPAEYLSGDVDHDEKITTTDARLTLQFTADKITADKLDTALADVDKDEKVTTTDARKILQFAAQKITSFD